MVNCKKCGQEYELKSGKRISDFQCECGGELKLNEIDREIRIGWYGVFILSPLGILMGIILLTHNDNRAKKYGIIQIILSIVWIYVIMTFIYYLFNSAL